MTSLQGLGSDGTTPGVSAVCWDGRHADDAGPSRGVRRPEHYLVISRISIFRLDRKASVGIKVDVVCMGAPKGRALGARALPLGPTQHQIFSVSSAKLLHLHLCSMRAKDISEDRVSLQNGS